MVIFSSSNLSLIVLHIAIRNFSNEFKSKESQISTFCANDWYQDALEYQNLVNMAELDLDRDPTEFETLAQTKIKNLLKQFGESGLHDVLEFLIVTKPRNDLPFAANGSPGFERLMENSSFSNQLKAAFNNSRAEPQILGFSQVKFDPDARNYARALLLYGACRIFLFIIILLFYLFTQICEKQMD